MSDKQFLDYDGLKRLVMNIRTAIHNAGHIVYMGTVKNVDALPDISTQAVGWMYTISEEGYTTVDFTDGEGQYISAYSEVAILNVDGQNKWSILGPIFDMPAIQKAISDEAAARTAADNELQAQITSNKTAIETEATDRENADNELQSQITSNKTAIETEATDRENADNALQSQITSNKTAIETEAVAREAGDTANKTAIETEATNRTNADTELQSQITSNKAAIETLNGTGNGSVSKTVTDEIAKVVANAPEDFDTLKEISDWIDTHEDSASAMNTQIQANKNEIASLKTAIDGKAAASHTHSASDITSGTLPIARGGTGQTTQADINKAFVGELEEGTSDVTDGTMFVSSYTSDNGFADTNATNVPYKRKFSAVWNYIKGKISSVLGLTASNYGGKASTAGTADKAIQDGNGKNIASTYVKKSGDTITGSLTVNDEIHTNFLYPKDDISASFWFEGNSTRNYIPQIQSPNCVRVFNNDMCLRYYYLQCNSVADAKANIPILKKLFAGMLKTFITDAYCNCVSIRGSIDAKVNTNLSVHTFSVSDIYNFGYWDYEGGLDISINGNVTVSDDFSCSYLMLLWQNDSLELKQSDAFILADEILKNKMANTTEFRCHLSFVLAEHL